MTQEPADLTEFKGKLWNAVMKRKREYNWCGTEIHILHRSLGVTAIPAATEPEFPEPAEDGIYKVSNTTYFFIRYTEAGRTYWLITALHQPQRNTSQEAGTWADVVTFMREKGLLPSKHHHRELVKF